MKAAPMLPARCARSPSAWACSIRKLAAQISPSSALGLGGGDQHGVHEPFPGHGARSLASPATWNATTARMWFCDAYALLPSARLSMPAHAVSLRGRAAATRQLFSAVRSRRASWSRAPRRLRAPAGGLIHRRKAYRVVPALWL